MLPIQLTKRTIDALPLAAAGQVLYRDRELRGFGLRVGSRSKVFFVEGQVAHRTVRVTIGRYGPLSPDAARRIALQHLSEMTQGRHPTEQRRRAERHGITVRDAFVAFFAAKPKLSPRTVDGYTRTVEVYLADWASCPLASLTRQMALSKYREIARTRGGATANNALRHFRSVYNTVAASEDTLPPNPVAVVTQARAWEPQKRRRRLVPATALATWWAAVMEEPPLSRDLLLVALFTGMRRSEIIALRWENIDLKARTLEVPRTKNGDPLHLPLSSFLSGLLAERRQLVGDSPWVFPTRSRLGHVAETKSFTIRVGQRCSVTFSLHDLRRTFVTIAESLDIPAYTLKRLLNHRASTDVTGGYIIIDVGAIEVTRRTDRAPHFGNHSWPVLKYRC